MHWHNCLEMLFLCPPKCRFCPKTSDIWKGWPMCIHNAHFQGKSCLTLPKHDFICYRGHIWLHCSLFSNVFWHVSGMWLYETGRTVIGHSTSFFSESCTGGFFFFSNNNKKIKSCKGLPYMHITRDSFHDHCIHLIFDRWPALITHAWYVKSIILTIAVSCINLVSLVNTNLSSTKSGH